MAVSSLAAVPVSPDGLCLCPLEPIRQILNTVKKPAGISSPQAIQFPVRTLFPKNGHAKSGPAVAFPVGANPVGRAAQETWRQPARRLRIPSRQAVRTSFRFPAISGVHIRAVPISSASPPVRVTL